jgi:putative redox protein
MTKKHSKRVRFDNGRGQQIAGIMEWPHGNPRAFAVFSHCFTCGKDLKATVRISRRLAESGICVLRYDFTGLGDSEGDFSQTNFTTNCLDIRAAADFLEQQFSSPRLLIGHSLGGTASVVTANHIESVQAVATIAAPGSTHRLAGFLAESNPQIESHGEGIVAIGGFNYLLRRQLLEDLRSYDIESEIARLRAPILIFHSPIDRTLPYNRGLRMFEAATSAKSFITLDGSDHLLVEKPADVHYVADMIDGWSSRYLQGPGGPRSAQAPESPDSTSEAGF